MHEAVFEAGWDSNQLMRQHRRVISNDHKGQGREVISLDWTQAHHEKGYKIYGVEKGYDYVNNRYGRFQTLVTAAIANRYFIDGIDVIVQEPWKEKAEKLYLKATAKQNYEDMAELQKRLKELLHFRHHQLRYKKRTEIVVEIVERIEDEGFFPHANYAFDNGVLTLPLTRLIEERGKHWVSEIEKSRNILWFNKWTRVDNVCEHLHLEHPESFRHIFVREYNGTKKEYWAFTKTVRLKRYGKKRLVIVHKKKDLSDKPRFLLTSALHWESGRVIETWSYRWPIETFHEFSKQHTGLEDAQVRNQEAVNRHFRLSCVSQSFLQRIAVPGSTSERFAFAKGKATIGQKERAFVREVFKTMLEKIQRLFQNGHSVEQVLEVLMPA